MKLIFLFISSFFLINTIYAQESASIQDDFWGFRLSDSQEQTEAKLKTKGIDYHILEGNTYLRFHVSSGVT